MTVRPTRRALVAGAVCAAAAAAVPRLVLAQADTDARLVLVVLRGGLDGLAAVPPVADRGLAALRRDLVPDGALPLGDGRFALHPALAPLEPWYREGALAVVHAVATPYRERSHFDAQDLLENGTAAPRGAADGWLNRAVGLLGSDGRRLGIAFGQGVPLVLRGPTPVASWAPSPLPEADPSFHALVARMYRGDPVLSAALADGLAAAGLAADAGAGMGGGGAGGAGRRSVRPLAEAAGRMLAAADGPRVAVLEVPGWDTHAGQAQRIVPPLAALAEALAALRAELGPAWSRTVVAVTTEFGRTVAANGTGGTDHGTATVALLAGGAVAGGRVVGRWPGLGERDLHEGRDLAPTTDLRAVLQGVLRDHLGLRPADLRRAVFPGDPPPAADGLVRA